MQTIKNCVNIGDIDDFNSKIEMFSACFNTEQNLNSFKISYANLNNINAENVCYKPNQRYKSWEYCRQEFYSYYVNNVKGKSAVVSVEDKKHLALHLAFYLASWGMYRGSSFLLQNDYLIHVPIVEEILNIKYDILWNYNPANKTDTEQVCNLLFGNDNEVGLVDKIKNHYLPYKNSAIYSLGEGDLNLDSFENDKSKNVSNELSKILVTKIIMGTFGCLPAYDRFFVAGIKDKKWNSKFSKNGFFDLIDVINENFVLKIAEFKVKKEFKVYTNMKFIDMYFWEHGFELDIHKWLTDVDKTTNLNNVQKLLNSKKTQTRTIKKLKSIKARFELLNIEHRCNLQNQIINLCNNFLN